MVRRRKRLPFRSIATATPRPFSKTKMRRGIDTKIKWNEAPPKGSQEMRTIRSARKLPLKSRYGNGLREVDDRISYTRHIHSAVQLCDTNQRSVLDAIFGKPTRISSTFGRVERHKTCRWKMLPPSHVEMNSAKSRLFMCYQIK